MKKTAILSVAIASVILFSCGRDKSQPNSVYMPDMMYSRAIETYSNTDTLKAQGIFYNATPVKGTVKRGELFTFSIEMDKVGDSTNYIASRQVVNPLPAMDAVQTKEAERLYLVNCGICHGAKMDGNGPLYNDGKGPYSAAPRALLTDPVVVNMPDGQMFYSVSYGKNLMGGYASQMSTTQRWMVIQYIKNKQKPAAPVAPAATADTTVKN